MALVRKPTNNIHSESGQWAAKSFTEPQLDLKLMPHWNSSAKKNDTDHAATMQMDAAISMRRLLTEKMRK
jgi:hypothetical protein